MSDELNNLFKRPSSEDCAESLYVVLCNVKAELLKLGLLQPELKNQMYYQGQNLGQLEQMIERILYQDLPKFMRKES